MRDYVIIYVNGTRHEVRGARTFRSLSDFLRYDLGLIGTKVVCAEGDCGSCTIFLGRPGTDGVQYRTACSCIQFLYQLDCTHIVTVEGLKYDGKLNPIQEAMVTCQGSQCGFCTPGFIVSMQAMFEDRTIAKASTTDVQKACVGNLCRCTGYEAIMYAGSSVEPTQVRRLSQLYSDQAINSELKAHTSESVAVRDGNKSFCKPSTIAEACAFRRITPAARSSPAGRISACN